MGMVFASQGKAVTFNNEKKEEASNTIANGGNSTDPQSGQPVPGDGNTAAYSVIVLQDPDGAAKQGHSALLVGNVEDGYTYISKNGGEGFAHLKGKSDKDILRYESISGFLASEKGERYKDILLYTTNKENGVRAINAASVAVSSNYQLFASNCVGTVLTGLNAAGLTGIDPNVTRAVQPNRIFTELIYENRGGVYYGIKR